MTDIWLPPNDSRVVKLFRFLNVLDDARNILSPVKINVWLSNVSTASASFANLVAHDGHYAAAGFSLLWSGIAHVTHHFDKHERNLQALRMKEAP
jgi:hypothetical protein